jgi:hypothetical protein
MRDREREREKQTTQGAKIILSTYTYLERAVKVEFFCNM